MLRTRAVRWGLVCVAALLTGLIWRWVDSDASGSPLIWAGLIWIGVLSVLAWQSVVPWRRTLLLSMAAVVASLVVAEAKLWLVYWRIDRQMLSRSGFNQITRDARNNWHSIFIKDGPLGQHPPAGISIEDAAMMGKATVFDVHYTFDQNDLRISPPVNSTTSGCVLFFGDSFAFGWGVPDQDTASYQLGLMSGGSLEVYNFAFSEYGAHTMLALLQDGTVRKIAQCPAGKPVYAIAQILPDYIWRAVSTDMHGPRYILRNGTVMRRGSQGDGDYIAHDSIYISPPLFSILRKVHLYRDTIGEERFPDPFDTQRFVAIVLESRKEIQMEFPGAKFVVSVWDDFFPSPMLSPMFMERRAVEAALNRAGIETLSIERILPGYDQNPFKYCIPHEWHPNAAAHHRFAAYLFDHFINSPPTEFVGSSVAGQAAYHDR